MTKNDETRRISARQERALDFLAAGATITQAAKEIGVSRQTLSAWVNRDPFFRAALNERRADLWRSGQDRLRSMVHTALGAVGRGLAGDEGWRPGLKLLEMMGFHGDYGQIGHTDPITYVDEAAHARRPDPLDALIGEYGEKPVSEGERRRVLDDLAREGVLDSGPGDGPVG
jgi:hypothetical protein